MKSTIKKIVSLSLVSAMTIGALTACGGNGGNTSSSSDKPDSNNSGTTPAAQELVIGGIGPLTGGAATYGTAVKNGAELAIKEINDAGGVNGMKLKIEFQDDEHNAQKAINAYNVLKDLDIKLLIGTVTSGPCIAVAELTEDDNMFQLTPSGSAVDSISGKNAFRICFNDPNQGKASAQYIAEKKLASKVAVIYDSSDAYSNGIFETFKSEANERNLEIVTEQAFTSSNNTDFSVAIQKIKESGADLVFLPIYYKEAALILQQAKSAALDVKFFGCDGLDGLTQQLGDNAAIANGVMLLTPFAADAKDEKTQTFVKAYKAAYGEDQVPNQFAADAYDAVYTVKAALEKANITDASISASDLCDKLVEAMPQITVEGVTGTMTWTDDGEPTKDPKGMSIVDGSYKAMD